VFRAGQLKTAGGETKNKKMWFSKAHADTQQQKNYWEGKKKRERQTLGGGQFGHVTKTTGSGLLGMASEKGEAEGGAS